MASIAHPARKPGPLARARRWASGFKERDTWVAYAFLLPWFVGFVVFIAGPMVASLILSFTDYSVIEKTSWVGTQNYHDLVHDPKVVTAMRNSFVYTLMAVPLEMVTKPPSISAPKGPETVPPGRITIWSTGNVNRAVPGPMDLTA